VPFLE